jgi:hypothetical protein
MEPPLPQKVAEVVVGSGVSGRRVRGDQHPLAGDAVRPRQKRPHFVPESRFCCSYLESIANCMTQHCIPLPGPNSVRKVCGERLYGLHGAVDGGSNGAGNGGVVLVFDLVTLEHVMSHILWLLTCSRSSATLLIKFACSPSLTTGKVPQPAQK